MDGSDQFLHDLRSADFYAGQIYRCEDLPSEKACVTSCQAFLEELERDFRGEVDTGLVRRIFEKLGLRSLYANQSDALIRLLSPVRAQDTILATPEGSGRSTVADILVCYRVLAHAANALILCPDDFSAEDRYLTCQRTIDRLGLGYAIRIDRLDHNCRAPASPAEVVVCTPQQLASIINAEMAFAPTFFSCLNLMVAEDIHAYRGLYGANVSALMRCLNILIDREGVPVQVFATAAPFKNITTFAIDLFDRHFDDDATLLVDSSGATRKRIIFWNSPLKRNEENKNQFARKDHIEDLRDLLRFLANYGIATSSSDGRMLGILLDHSGSMCGGKYERVVDSLCTDLHERLQRGELRGEDWLEISRFTTRKQDAVVGCQLAEFGTGLEDRLKELLSEVEPGGGTDIGNSLLEFLTGVESDLARRQTSRIVVFIYSDGECDVSESQSHKILAAMDRIVRGLSVPIELHYISLGIAPHPTVRVLVEQCLGVVHELPNEASIQDLGPGAIWFRENVDRRPVVTICHSDAVSFGDIANLGECPRRVLLKPNIGFPSLLDVLSPERNSLARSTDIRAAQFVVVVGWNGSPAFLKHHLQHVGRNDSYVFVVTTLNPLSQLLIRQWRALSAPKESCDYICTNAFSRPASLNAIKHLAKYLMNHLPLHEEEAFVILRGKGSQESADAPLLRNVLTTEGKLSLSAGGLVSLQEKEVGKGLGHWRDFHTTESGIQLGMAGRDSMVAMTDSSAVLRGFLGGTTVVLNGTAYDVEARSAKMIVLRSGAGNRWAYPRFTLQVRMSDAEALAASKASASIPFMVSANGESPWLSLESVQVEARVTGRKLIPGGRFDERGAEIAEGSLEKSGQTTVSFGTLAAVIEYKQAEMDIGLKAGLENIAWTFLNGLVWAEPNSIVATSIPDRSALYILDLVPGGGGIAKLLAQGNFSLLNDLLRMAARSLLICPCETETSLAIEGLTTATVESENLENVADFGCPFCLRAPTKPVGQDEKLAKKRELLQFLGGCGVSVVPQWEQLVGEKYGVVQDNTRFVQSAGYMEEGYVNTIAKVMLDKLGIEPAHDGLGSYRFATCEESAQHPNVAGWYDENGQIRIKPKFNEFHTLDILSHEMAHSWQDSECKKGVMGPLTAYDLENIEAEVNIPFRGRLFVEGSAVWLEAHVMEYFNNRLILSEQNLAVTNEYWQGFRCIKYLEERWGVSAALAFQRDGILPAEIADWRELVLRAGVGQAIQNAGREAVDDGRLACLRSEFLNKSGDITSISTFLKDDPREGFNPDEFVRRVTLRDGTNHVSLNEDTLRRAVLLTSLCGLMAYEPAVEKLLVDANMLGCLVSQESSRISLWTAAHLHSNSQLATSEILAPFVDLIMNRVKRDVRLVPNA